MKESFSADLELKICWVPGREKSWESGGGLGDLGGEESNHYWMSYSARLSAIRCICWLLYTYIHTAVVSFEHLCNAVGLKHIATCVLSMLKLSSTLIKLRT